MLRRAYEFGRLCLQKKKPNIDMTIVVENYFSWTFFYVKLKVCKIFEKKN